MEYKQTICFPYSVNKGVAQEQPYAILKLGTFFERIFGIGRILESVGFGLSKAQYIGKSKSPEMISLMRSIKQLFDPKGILNPYKVLPKVR